MATLVDVDGLAIEPSLAKPIQTKHGFYQRIVDDLGCKVFKQRGLQRTQVEYLFNLHAQYDVATTGLTCEALACGTIRMGDIQRPCIWLRHIEGVTVYDYQLQMGWRHNSTFTAAQAEAWAQEAQAFKPIIRRMMYIIQALKSIGISCADHEENTTNFMIDINGVVKAIDYSMEDKYVAKDVLKRIYEKHEHRLNITVPTSYIHKLESIGLYL